MWKIGNEKLNWVVPGWSSAVNEDSNKHAISISVKLVGNVSGVRLRPFIEVCSSFHCTENIVAVFYL